MTIKYNGSNLVELVLRGLAMCGSDGKGSGGIQGFVKYSAQRNPEIFARHLMSRLPEELSTKSLDAAGRKMSAEEFDKWLKNASTEEMMKWYQDAIRAG
jgi:hypothetical protein